MTDQRPVTIRWLHRAPTNSAHGSLLHEATPGLPNDIDADWFVACEATALRRIRDHLRNERNIDSGWLQTRGYWKAGETDYPDHDCGED